MVECRYCHQSIEIRRGAPPSSPIANTRVVYVTTAEPAQRRAAPIALIAGLLVPLLIGIAVTWLTFSRAQVARPAGVPQIVSAYGGEHLQWHTIGPVFPVHLNDDAAEDVVGPYRILEQATLRVFVGAFDGASGKRLWGAGPFVSAEELQHLQYAASGNRVAVADARATLHLLDLRTGEPIATAKLSDRVRRMCGAPSGAARFYVETVDDAAVFVEADGAITTGPRPDFCRDTRPSGRQSDCERLPLFLGPELPCLPLGSAPKVKGLQPKWAIGSDSGAVIIGVRTPGSRVPMAAGYVPGSREARWTRLIPTGDPLSVKEGDPPAVDLKDDTFYAYYELASGLARLVAIDLQTGETRWDVAVPNSTEGTGPQRLVIGRDRVYVPHWTWLDLFDRKTGQHLGTIGRW
jgi:hypothetical protein